MKNTPINVGFSNVIQHIVNNVLNKFVLLGGYIKKSQEYFGNGLKNSISFSLNTVILYTLDVLFDGIAVDIFVGSSHLLSSLDLLMQNERRVSQSRYISGNILPTTSSQTHYLITMNCHYYPRKLHKSYIYNVCKQWSVAFPCMLILYVLIC